MPIANPATPAVGDPEIDRTAPQAAPGFDAISEHTGSESFGRAADTKAPTEGKSEVRLEGEVMPAPRGLIVTTLLALSGLLFVIHGVRLFARLALAFERPGELVVSSHGIRFRSTTRMLGRTLRDREHVMVRAGLVRVTREVRYPRAAFYAGLLALALGSWLGVRTLVDGVRAASPSLLVIGLAIVTIGIAADFLLGSLLPGSRGRCRMVIVPRTGATLCLGNVDAKRANEVLASVFEVGN